MKPTHRRSWAGNLLMFSDLTLGPSFKVRRWFTFLTLDLSFKTVLIKSAYNSLIIGRTGWDGKPTYRKSWAGNLLVWLDLTLQLSFKVKRG